jgi:tetratricopeptide (TPR) repeat protein
MAWHGRLRPLALQPGLRLNRRTLLLLALLASVAAAGAWYWQERETADPSKRSASATSNEPARPSHPRISDAAGILAPFGPRLGRMADEFNSDLGIDVHVVTISEPGSIESQSERIFRERGVGTEAATGGLLVLLNARTREARIEVGYTLEGGLTDLHMGRIARDQLAPYVSYASAGMGVMDVLHYLRDQAYLAAALGNISLGEAFRARPAYAEYERFVSGGAGAKTALADIPMDADLKRAVPPGRRARYAPSADVEQSVAAFLRASADLAGDPTLPLFTEGSRRMRAQYPLARFEELKRLERVDASLPLEYHIEGDYAVATSARPATGFVPILLHREDKLWRIDHVETWKNLFFDADGNYFLRNNNTPYRFGLEQFGKGRWHDIGQVALDGRSIADSLDGLEGEVGVLPTLRRAEIHFRNAFVFPPALADYEEAVKMAPEDPYVLQTFAERALYLGFPELAIPALLNAGPGFELTLAEAYNDLGEARAANAWVARALEEDPYNLHALNWREYLATEHGTAQEQQLAEAEVALVRANPSRHVNPVWLTFEPERPRFHPEAPLQSDGVTVHDHSQFRVTMTNTSRRPVVIESVRLASHGTARASGLGDVKEYWDYPSGQHHLAAGESVSFDKLWGFTVDTGHDHVRYTFRTCWHGVGEPVRQCRTQWVDVLP